ncbi:O-antigen ligase family protein [Cupriavidus sp. USMAHM13]|uniref:O-antigen ligase family protein n=1 Tax=Cupriavidus sp. USMAHM13 TaxID=1389192 RepID=UPI0018D4417D|nr:O-antigen ligase family protein [Cupriavidus sp. USMAHM13]
MTDSQQIYRLAVLAFFFVLAVNRLALIYSIPYVFYSPVALMADVPLIAMISGALAIHALLEGVGRRAGSGLATFWKYWVPILLALIGVSLFSAILSDEIMTALPIVMLYVQGLILLLLLCFLIKSEGEYRYFLISICLASSAAFIYKVICYYSEAPPALLATALTAATDWESKSQIFLDQEFVKRLLWLGQEPNYVAALHFVPVAVALSLSGKITRFRFLLFCCAAVNIMQIFGTLSRAGAVSLVAMMVLIILFGGLKSKRRLQILIVGVLAIVLLYSQAGYVFDRLGSIQSSVANDGASGRFEFWGQAINLINSSPIFGVGPGGFRLIVGDAAHNTYIEALAELGFVGGLVYFACVSFPLIYLLMKRERSDRVIAFGYLAYLIMGFTLTFYQFFLTIFMGFICVSASSGQGRVAAVSQRPDSFRPSI